MALVGEVVARFKIEASDYLKKIDTAKAKNKELATELLKTADSADQAVAALTAAKNKNALGDFGIDKRQVSGIISSIKQIEKEGTASFKQLGKEARGYGQILKSVDSFQGGNFLKGFGQLFKGLSATEGGSGNQLLLAGLGATIANVVGKGLHEATSKARELKTQFAEGKISAGEMKEELINTIPVFGNFWAAGRDIKDIFSDWSGELAKVQKAEESLAKAFEEADKTEEARRKAVEQAKKGTASIITATDIAGKKAAGLEGTAAYDESVVRANEDLSRFAEETNSAFDKEIQAKKRIVDEATTLMRATEGRGAGSRVNEKDYENAIRVRDNTLKIIDDLEKKRQDILRARREAVAKQTETEWKAQHGDLTPEEVDAAKFAENIGKDLQAKGKPILDWIKNQFEEGKKEWEGMTKEADKIKDKLKTPAQQLNEDLSRAILLRNNKLLSNGDLDNLMTKDAKDLLKEQKDLQNSAKDVYKLPEVSQLRAGQTLYAPPSRIEEKSLERLGQIKDELVAIKNKSNEAGVVIEELH